VSRLESGRERKRRERKKREEIKEGWLAVD